MSTKTLLPSSGSSPFPVNGGKGRRAGRAVREWEIDAERAGDLGKGHAPDSRWCHRRSTSPSTLQSERVGGGVHPLVDPCVEHVDELFHQLRHVQDLDVAAPSLGKRLAARVADAADLVHPLLARGDPLFAQDSRVVALVLQVAVGHVVRPLRRPDVVVHLVADVDLRHEGGLVRSARQQHVLAVLHQHRQPPARRTVVGDDAVEHRLPVASLVESGRVVDAAADSGAG